MRRLRAPFWRIATLLVIVPGLLAVTLAQEPPKKPRKEEEEEPKKPRKEDEEPKKPPMGKKNEEEEGGGEVPGGIIRVDDPRKDPKKPASAPSDQDLAAAAARATHPGIKKLFTELALPHDKVHIKTVARDATERVKPLPEFLARGGETGQVKLTFLDRKDPKEREQVLSASALKEVTHYEMLALREVDAFLATRWENAAGNLQLPVLDKVIAAEQALRAVDRFHESARADQTRKGDGWTRVRENLRQKLLDLILQRMQALAEKDDWESAINLAGQTLERFSTREEQRVISPALSGVLSRLIDTVGLSDARHKKALEQLRQLEETRPGEATEPIRKRLSELAEPLVRQALELKKAGKLQEAQVLVARAREIYPKAPGLGNLSSDVEGEYPILRVGVKELPQYFSPARAFTDAEKQAVELIFESLFELGPEPDSGRYRVALARNQPTLVPLGREIHLPRDVYWADGTRLEAKDVSATLALLRNTEYTGRSSAWADDLIDDIHVVDPFRFRLTLKQGHLDPLSLMRFKILPSHANLRKPDEKNFAQAPVGTGPYMLDPNPRSGGGRPMVRFLANPYYRNRIGKEGLPRIREIQFLETRTPRPDEKPDAVAKELLKEFTDGQLDLLLDVPASLVKPLQSARPQIKVVGPLPTRRVHLLAVNHRRTHLDSAPLRRALALAIPREEILKDCFRGGLDNVHQPLTGPFPVNSWANDPAIRLDSAKAKGAHKDSGKGAIALELKYPAGDPAVAKAMQAIQAAVKAELGIDLKLRERSLHNLRADVESDHDYDLAYYWYDYPDSTFWFYPLIDPRDDRKGGDNRPGGPNFCGCKGLTDLQALCQEALRHRDFQRVRKITHMLHRQFAQQDMPFIPLWQLDRHLVLSNRIDLLDGVSPLKLEGAGSTIDPLRVFGTVETWRAVRK